MNPAFRNASHDLLCPGADLLAFVPHVTEIQSADTFVAIHQPDGIVTRHLLDGLYSSTLTQNSRGRGYRHTEHSHATSRAQSAKAFLPASAAQRIDDQFNAAFIRETQQDREPILISVIDRMIQTALFEEL